LSISLRTFAVPTIAASVLITTAACSTQPTARGAAGQPGPAAGPSTSAALVAAAQPAAATLPVVAAPKGTASRAVLGSVSSHGKVASATAQLQVKSYDAKTGTVVLSAADVAPPAKRSSPSASPRPAAPSNKSAATSAPAVQTGQLIASPPTATAPHGFLAAVTAVHPEADGTVAVSTKPADLSQLLGQSQAQGTAPVPAPSISVQPLIGNLQTTFTTSPGAAAGSAADTLGLTVNGSVPIPGTSGSAAFSGSVDLNPSVSFSYDGAGFLKAPQQAHIGFNLGAQAQWKVSASLAANTSLRIPLANLSASPVLTVAGFPIVINLGLSVYLVVGADGQTSLSVSQTFNGAWSVGADYTTAGGWTSHTDPGTTKVSPIQLTASGDASVTAGVEADASVGLYNAVGIEGTVEPYLRSQLDGTVKLDTAGDPPTVSGGWALFGGINIGGDLYAQLAILGAPPIAAKIPLIGYSHEWPLYTLGAPVGSPTPSASASPSATGKSAP